MAKVESVPLQSVAEIERAGIAPVGMRDESYVSLEDIDSVTGEIRITARGLSKSTKFRFGPEHVLYGKLRPYLRKVARPTAAGFCSTDILPIRPSDRLDRDYLFHFLRTPSFSAKASQAAVGINLPRLSPSLLSTFAIPLPPLSEQRRIAALLDKADALRAKRRAALAHLDTLTQSIFLDMFGDPRIRGSTGGTPTKPTLLGELTRIRTGKLDANAANENGAYPFFTCAVEPLRINVPAYDCKAVLVAGNGDLNVKYYEGPFNAYQRTYVIESLDESVLVPQFLYAFLDLYVSELRKQAIGGVIKYIKLPYLTDAVVQLPSEQWQLEFTRRLAAGWTLKTIHQASLTALDALFASLQHRAFRGEL